MVVVIQETILLVWETNLQALGPILSLQSKVH